MEHDYSMHTVHTVSLFTRNLSSNYEISSILGTIDQRYIIWKEIFDIISKKNHLLLHFMRVTL